MSYHVLVSIMQEHRTMADTLRGACHPKNC
jgi:hypothetical protein